MPTRAHKHAPPPIQPGLVTHLHSALALSSYALQFNRIVADPDTALLSSLLPLVAFQGAYAAICLDSFGSGKRPKAASRSASGTKKTDPPPSSWVGEKLLPITLSLLFALTVGTAVISSLLVLFGAPFTTHHRSTILCAAHISMLSIFPLVYNNGVDGSNWRSIVAALMPLDEVYAAAIGTFIGAWAGAVPIPLDWDREWQKWPVTILTGAYLGYALGKIGGMYVFKGKKLLF
ncbi:GPI-anchor biosynthesis protein-like protein [Peziza echinospora]|nr:GPI-anchor biosynthesis protein-like protein [Peziza echinospora]